MDATSRGTVFRFGAFRLDRRSGLARLREGGRWEPVALGSRALHVLTTLVEQRGELVTKQALMDAVWPGTTVEDANLTVQISAVRRILDDGCLGDSRIQTVIGRGYRFVVPAETTETAKPSGRPRLSIVVLPFGNLDGALSSDGLAGSITQSLTTELSRLEDAIVIARGETGDLRQICEESGVRYAVDGSIRVIGDVARINVQLISTETGLHVWSDRFDQELGNLAEAEDFIVRRMALGLRIAVVEDESRRGLQERPDTPDALDLVLRGRSLIFQPTHPDRHARAHQLFEDACRLDPKSVAALTGLADVLNSQFHNRGYWLNGDEPVRLQEVVVRAQAIAPTAERVLGCTAMWLETRGRHMEAMAIASRMIETFPMGAYGYGLLARSKIYCGGSAEAIPLLRKAIRLHPYHGSRFDRYWRMGFAHLLTHQEKDALDWFNRAVAAYPDAPGRQRAAEFKRIAAAYALIGEIDEAYRAMDEVNRAWPFNTVRGVGHENYQSSVYAEQFRHYHNGLRLAGMRDHSDEYADFGAPAGNTLISPLKGYTPTVVAGVQTIGTAELERFLRYRAPLVLDTMNHFWGRSLPGAIGLEGSGVGGSFMDKAQDRLTRKMPELIGSDLSVPIVAVGYNSETFDGHNLALRLSALGCTNIFWYRGGREAWEVSELPEVRLAPTDW
jgi:DNA-binding winged helix-turn-helix (wHTH) protein/tetratricopeptide (TPR) repeat protein